MPPSIPTSPLEHPDIPAPCLGSRELFPDLAFSSFLAHAAISPTSLATKRAVETYLGDASGYGSACFPRWMAQRERLRSSLAKLLGTEEQRVSLSPGCTRGITDVALALPWQAGQRLLTFAGEFPTNVIPWQQAARLRDGSVDLLALPEPSDPSSSSRILESVEAAILKAKRTARPVGFVAVSAVQFQTGLRMPVAELGALCHAHEIYFLVDGIQACGVLPLHVDSWRVDAFFSGAHKWMLGLEGAGFLSVSEKLAERLAPLTAGWLSYEDGANFLFQGADQLRYDRKLLPNPLSFEGSTLNAAGFAALEAGVDICQHLKPQNIFEHVQEIHDRLEPLFLNRGFKSLRSSDPALRSCLLSFEPPVDLQLGEFAGALREQGVMISTPDGKVRLSPHFANSVSEIEIVETALAAALG